MTRFWLIRHGEPEARVRERCYGSLDVGVSQSGRDRMRRVAKDVQPGFFDRIYSSPSRRALESARILAEAAERPIEIFSGLREMHFGDFEGLTYDEAAAQNPEVYRRWMETPAEVQFPNGESFRQMQSRVLDAFDMIHRAREGRTVAIVSHGGVNRILLAWALGMPDEHLFRLAQNYGAVNLLTLTAGFPMVQLMNSDRLTY